MEGKQMEGKEGHLEVVQQWLKIKMALLVKDAVSLFLAGLITPLKLFKSC